MKKIITVLVLIQIHCTKSPNVCSKDGVVYTYQNLNCFYEPTSDSISLSDSIILRGAIPKTFCDVERNHFTTISKNEVLGSLQILSLSPSISGGVNKFRLTPVKGAVIKDTVQFTSAQLLTSRISLFEFDRVDSFRFQLVVKPLERGIFSISLGQQGNHDLDCARYIFFLRVGNNNQHLHYLASANGGHISEYASKYAYCFKVF